MIDMNMIIANNINMCLEKQNRKQVKLAEKEMQLIKKDGYVIFSKIYDGTLILLKNGKPFCADLKPIYQAPAEEKTLEAMERVTEKWSEKYPNSMRSWKQNWDAIS